MSASLLGNMQNDFDNKFGDLCGQVGARFFIMEFKPAREAFKDEISLSAKGKLNRAALYDHLHDDSHCRRLSDVGHFGAYANENNQLVFEPYARCMVDKTDEELILRGLLLKEDTERHELNYASWASDFSTFYQDTNQANSDLSDYPAGYFKVGLGLTKTHLQAYVECMYQHLQDADNDMGEVVLCAMHPVTGEMVAFRDTLANLLTRLHQHFNESQSMTKPNESYDFDVQPDHTSPSN